MSYAQAQADLRAAEAKVKEIEAMLSEARAELYRARSVVRDWSEDRVTVES